jgi:hypothetical protein
MCMEKRCHDRSHVTHEMCALLKRRLRDVLEAADSEQRVILVVNRAIEDRAILLKLHCIAHSVGRSPFCVQTLRKVCLYLG